MINIPQICWNNVLFADKSKFNIFGFDGRITVWKRKNDELHFKNIVGTVDYDGGSFFCVRVRGQN